MSISPSLSADTKKKKKIGIHLLPGRTTWNRCNTDCEGRPPGSDRKSLGRCRPLRFRRCRRLSRVRPRQRNDRLAVCSASDCRHYGRPSDGTPRRFSRIKILLGAFAQTNKTAETTTGNGNGAVQNDIVNIRNSNAISLCLSPSPYTKSVINKVTTYYHLRSCIRVGATAYSLPIFSRRVSELGD